MTIIEQTFQASISGNLVRVHREGLEDGWADGYIAAVGTDFFALELVSDSIRFDGFNCLRYADVTTFENPAPYANFQTKALGMRGLHRQESLPVDLSGLSPLLRTAGAAFPLLTIHIESSDPDVCFIGKVASVSDERLDLIQVTPDAECEVGATQFALSEITRVDFGGDYEDALLLVAGHS